MRLMCRQLIDGERSGDAFEVDTFGAAPGDYLERKVASALGNGWTVEDAPEGGVHAFKEYDTPEGTLSRKDRFMWVDDGG